jgi:uncharacterized protein YjbI with pentapeptide repeats/TolA-binding protein
LASDLVRVKATTEAAEPALRPAEIRAEHLQVLHSDVTEGFRVRDMTPRLLIGSALCLTSALLGASMILWSTQLTDPTSRIVETVGGALVSGSVIALVVFCVESARDVKLHESAIYQAFVLQVSFSRDLTEFDFSERDLRGISLRGKRLTNANLSGARLTGVDLTGCDLRGADLRRADLRKATLDTADLRLADLRHADLTGGHLNAIDGRGADFCGAKLAGSSLQHSNFDLMSPSEMHQLRNVEGVKKVRWYYNVAEQTRPTFFRGADLRRTDWRSSSAVGAEFNGANFSYALLGRGELPDLPSRTFLYLWLIKREDWMLTGGNHFLALKETPLVLRDADLEGAILDGANLSGVEHAIVGLLRNAGDIEGAGKAYQQAIDSGHADAAASAAMNLGILLHDAGDTEGARKAYQQAIDSGDTDAASTATIGLGRLLRDAGDVEGARKAFQQAADSGHPDLAPRGATSLGMLLEDLGDVEGARAAFQQAADSGHADLAPMAVFSLGRLLRDAGDAEGARQALQQAIDYGHSNHRP